MNPKKTLKNYLAKSIEIPKSYTRYLNYIVEENHENQYVVKTPHGTKVFFEVSGNSLRKIKQERSIININEKKQDDDSDDYMTEDDFLDDNDQEEESEEEVEKTQDSEERVEKNHHEQIDEMKTTAQGNMAQAGKTIENFAIWEEYLTQTFEEKINLRFEEIEQKFSVTLESQEKSEIQDIEQKLDLHFEEIEQKIAEIMPPEEKTEVTLDLEQKLTDLEKRLEKQWEQGTGSEANVDEEQQRQWRSLDGRVRELENQHIADNEQPSFMAEDRNEIFERLDKLEQKILSLEDLAKQNKAWEKLEKRVHAVENRFEKQLAKLQKKQKTEKRERSGEEQQTSVKAAVVSGTNKAGVAGLTVGKKLWQTVFYLVQLLFAFLWKLITRWVIPNWKVVAPGTVLIIIVAVIALNYQKWWGTRPLSPAQNIQEKNEENEQEESDIAEENQEEEKDDSGREPYHRKRAFRRHNRHERPVQTEENKAEVTRLLGLIQDGSMEERKEAINQLGELRARRAGNYIKKSLDDPQLRWYAIRALGKIRFRPATSELAEIAKNQSNALDIREDAIIALGQIKSTSAIKGLLEILKNQQENNNLRANSVVALAKIGRTDIYQHLMEQLADPDPAVRQEITQALGRYPYAVPKLAKLLKTGKDISVRISAASALGYKEGRTRRSNIKSADALLEVLQEENLDKELAKSIKEALKTLLPELPQDKQQQAKQILNQH